MRKQPKRIGLAIVGAGRVGLIRGELAKRFPQVDWIGLAEKNPDRAKLVAEKVDADFVTADFRELLKQPEVTAVVVSTDEHLHVEPIMAGRPGQDSHLRRHPAATRPEMPYGGVRHLRVGTGVGLPPASTHSQRVGLGCP